MHMYIHSETDHIGPRGAFWVTFGSLLGDTCQHFGIFWRSFGSLWEVLGQHGGNHVPTGFQCLFFTFCVRALVDTLRSALQFLKYERASRSLAKTGLFWT